MSSIRRSLLFLDRDTRKSNMDWIILLERRNYRWKYDDWFFSLLLDHQHYLLYARGGHSGMASMRDISSGRMIMGSLAVSISQPGDVRVMWLELFRNV